MANYVIVGAGAAGLYTAYRLLTGGTLQPSDTVRLYEWSQRPGGRIFSYTFPDEIGGNGLYAEFGGMRFATDNQFPGSIIEGHVLVQNMIVALGLTNLVVPFVETTNRMYYLRGMTTYEANLTSIQGLPYNFNSEFQSFLAGVQKPYTADNVLGQIAAEFAPNLGQTNADRSLWCGYYQSGAVGASSGTPSFPAGTLVQNMGYWNLLYDQLGDEGYDYCADGNGYTSNVINWNAADAMQANNDYGSSTAYCRLNGGYSLLFEALAAAVEKAAAYYPGSGILYNQQLVNLDYAENGAQTICYFSMDCEAPVLADYLFLAMPRRALELVASRCASTYMLNNAEVKYNLESSLDQPAIKAVLVFDQAWWAPSAGLCTHSPNLTPIAGAPDTQWVGGPTVTDLPLRMVYYFGNNVPNGPGITGGPYVLLASYDDMNYSNFWRELQTSSDYVQAPSLIDQPLTGPTSVPIDGPLAGILMKQLAEAHGADVANLPAPTAVYFQDWGQNPFGGGYHGWSAHYNICAVMDAIRAPAQAIMGSGPPVYIVGSCYSFDQAWVEGAFCTAESVLQDYFHLSPFAGVSNYHLICTPADLGAPTSR
jgi:hypothetical protein